MSPFLRFIFTLIVLGAVLNLAIVLVSNARSDAIQDREKAVKRERFAQVLKLLNRNLRRADMVVESQRIDANHNVIETSLLVRQYMPQEDAAVPLPSTRIIIPGNRVCIDGLRLSFDEWFNEEYTELRGMTLFYFAHVYADGIPKKDRFSFLIPDQVPLATQFYATGASAHPTYFENKLWQNLWTLIQQSNQAKAERSGLKATWLDPACKVVRGGTLYRMTVGLEGITVSEEDDASSRAAREDILREMKTPKQNP
jgi:hypothetical protein